jgi:large subunit ribosomal protein L23
VRNAIENIFKVKVVSETIINDKGKKRMVGRNVGKKSDWKKAIVRLAPGENIEFFEGV